MHLERLDGPGIAPRRSASLPSPRPGGRARGLILGVALACAAARPAPGQEPAPPAEPPAPSMHRFHAERWKGFEPGDIAERLSRAVDPTDEQRSQIQGLVERFRAQNADVLARSRALRDALRGARESGTRPSREDLDALARQYGYPGRELAPAVQGLREDVLDLLTPDQKQRLEDLRQRGRERWRDACPDGRRGFGPRSPAGPPPDRPPSPQ